MRKLFKGLIIAGSVVVALMGIVAVAGPALDTAGYRYIIGGSVLSYLKPANQKVKDTKEKLGGIIHGVCHPDEQDIDEIKAANIDWVRFDLSNPVLDLNGQETQSYKNFKNRCQYYADHDVKVMCVTPYPDAYLYSPLFGGNEDTNTISSVDPRTEEGLAHIVKDAKYIINDLKDCVGAFQITNEMPVDRFRKPLTLEEAAKYIGVQLEAMYQAREEGNNTIIGYNVADFQMFNLYKLVGDYNKYCDYLGLDLYLGCFEDMFKDLIWYDIILRGFYQQTSLPMIVNEFGYIGAGQTKTDEERKAFLNQFGYDTEEEAKADILNLVEHPSFNSRIRERMYEEFPNKEPENLADILFNKNNTNCYSQHFYEELAEGYQLTNYKHTREDQGKFYTDVIEDHFMKMNFLCGCIAYCWEDSSSCYICNSPNCPIETGWGFKALDGVLKPSYYAIQQAYAKWN